MILCMRHIAQASFIPLVLGLFPLLASAQGVSVTKQPVQVQHKTFDPKNPPKEMPPLRRDEAALTSSVFGLAISLSYRPSDEQRNANTVASMIRIESIQIRTTLTITVWLPPNAPAALTAHEEAHRQIGEDCYKDADAIARRVAGQFVNQSFTGEGVSTTAARKSATEKVTSAITAAYMKETRTPASGIDELFDQITDHGRKRIAVDKAMQEAKEKYREATREKQERRDGAAFTEPYKGGIPAVFAPAWVRDS